MDEWEKRQKEEPLKNRDVVHSKMISGFHVGVLAYENDELIGWISVGPLTDFNWTIKRALSIGNDAQRIVGILCFSLAPKHWGKGYQTILLKELIKYSKDNGWTSIEGYPFDAKALDKHGDKVAWPGFSDSFLEAGFQRIDQHWLNNHDYPRSIFKIDL